MYIRYEFDDIGIFHAIALLEDCDMKRTDKEDLEAAENAFERLLPVPDIEKCKKKICFYFNEKGMSKFKEELDILVRLFSELEEAGIGELHIIKKEHLHVVYEDEWQVAAVTEDCLQ